MCGRLNVSDYEGIEALLEQLGLDPLVPELPARFNIAPGAAVAVLRQEAGRRVGVMEWGLTPAWQTPERKLRPLFNARAETVWEKASFRRLVAAHRCIVPANGFYEWRREGKSRRAFHFQSAALPALPLAGIHGVSRDGVPQCCILTTAANPLMAPVHDRMPVILTPQSVATWLESDDRAELEPLLVPAEEGLLQRTEVSDYVNSSAHEGDRCVAPV